MAILNRVYTYGGVPVSGANGLLIREYLSAAPNGAEPVNEVRTLSGPEGNFVEADIPTLDPGYLRVFITWYAEDAEGNELSHQFSFVPIEGTNPLGLAQDVYGPLVGLEITAFEVSVESSAGLGSSAPRRFSLAGVIPLTVSVDPTLTGTVKENVALTTMDAVYSGGGADLTVAAVFSWAEDGSGTNDEGVTVTGGICPTKTGAFTHLRYGNTFTGSGVPGGTLTVWSGYVAIDDAVVETPVTLDDAPVIVTDPLTEGRAVVITPATYLGTPTSLTIITEWATDDSGTGATAFVFTGVLPADFGGRFFRYTERVTGFGIATFLDTSTAWVAIENEVLEALTDEEWPVIRVSAASATVTRIEQVETLESLNLEELWVGTATSEFMSANPFPAGFWQTTFDSTSGGHDVWDVPDEFFGTPPRNAREFDDNSESDTQRRLRLKVVGKINGVYTPASLQKTVPDPPPPPVLDRRWLRATMRKQGEAELHEVGGGGFQAPRAFGRGTAAGDQDFVILGVDITWPLMTQSFGDFYESVGCQGLKVGESVAGMVVDSGNADRILTMYSAGSLSDTGTYGDFAGIYQSLDRGANWELVKALNNVYGSNNPPLRNLVHYMCEGPGSTPETRTYYAIHAPAAYNSGSAGFGDIQVLKANANGGSSFANDGAALAKATYGYPFGIKCRKSNGARYLYTEKGVWRSPDGSTTWTKATGLPAGKLINHLEVHGSTVWVSAKGTGLYKATDATTLNFTQVFAYNIQGFSVSPADNDRILVSAAAEIVPKWSHDGGVTWTGNVNGGNITSSLSPGQTNTFDHHMWKDHCFFIWHASDPNLCLAMKLHHMGKSTDGGKTFTWASRGFDYSKVFTIGFHPTRPRSMFLTMTDRLLIYTDSALNFVVDDNITTDVKADIDAAVPNIGGNYSSSGALVLSRNNHVGLVAQVGKNTQRTPIISTRTVTQTNSGTGNGTLTGLTVGAGAPCGVYTFVCTTAAANGGTFTVTGPEGVALGTVTVGTPFNIALSTGSIAGTINDGSTDFAAGANAKRFFVDVNPLGAHTVLNPAKKSAACFGQVNPAVTFRGCSGRHCFDMTTGGVVSNPPIHSFDFDFIGYGGTGGSIIYGISTNASSCTVHRSTNEGDGGWSTWYDPGTTGNEHNFRAVGVPAVCVSSHSAERVWIGTRNGKIKKLQSSGGTASATVVFNFKTWMDENRPNDTYPGYAQQGGSGVYVPCILGIAESYYDPNILYCNVLNYGGPHVFCTKNALSANPTWENITGDGIGSVAANMLIHPTYDELFLFSRHGTTDRNPDADHRTLYGIATSVWDEIYAYLEDQADYIGV